MAAWSPTELMSNLASSLASSLRRAPRLEARDELIRNALLNEDEQDEPESNATSVRNSRAGSPEIPLLDSPSVFKMAARDENSDPNASVSRSARLSSRKRLYGDVSPKGLCW